MKKIIITLLAISLNQVWAGDPIRIAIGTQDATITTAAGGPIPRELHLLEKYLPHDGKYKDVTYDIQWKSFPSGPPLNNELLANKLDIGQMAEFPAVGGAVAFKVANNGVHTLEIATLTSGIQGAGNGLLVPINSPVNSVAELKGKTISVSFGTTAHAFLLRALQNAGLDPEKDVNLVGQPSDVGGSALKAGQVDARADYSPYAELSPFHGFARKILDGQSTGLTTAYGIQVRSDFAEKYPELVVAYLKATIEASRLIRENPEEYSEKIAKWSGIDAEVVYAFHGPHGIQVRDYTIKPEYIQAIAKAQETLKTLKKINDPIDVNTFVDDRFIRLAAKELGDDYEVHLKDYGAVPFDGKDFVTGAPIEDTKDVGQIWVVGEPKVRLYQNVTETFAALNQLEKEGKKVRIAFVHDHETGLKLIADKVWYVRRGNEILAYLEKSKAEQSAKNGALLTYAELRK